MELTVAKKDLLKLAGRMQGVAERKSTMPLLSCLLLVTEGDALRISATDLYISLSGQCPAQIKAGGQIALPAKDFVERVKAMPDGPLHLTSADGHTLIMKAAGSARKYTLRGVAATDFPPLPQPAEGSPSMGLDVGVLLGLILKTSPAISTDETRAHINSAMFEWDRNVVRMVATDGHRLTMSEVTVEGQATATMLLPLKAVHEIRRLCEDVASVKVEAGTDAADVKVGQKPRFDIVQSGPNAFFRIGGTTFSVKLVDAQFLPYRQVVPQTAKTKTTAPRSALADAVRAVAVAANDKTGGVKFAFSSGKVTITSESPDSGDGSDELAIDYTGAPIAIGFNAKYILDALTVLADDDVEISLNGDLGPIVIRRAGDAEFTAMVMPMRLS